MAIVGLHAFFLTHFHCAQIDIAQYAFRRYDCTNKSPSIMLPSLTIMLDHGSELQNYELQLWCLANAKSPEHGLQIFIYRWYHMCTWPPRSYSALGNI